MKYFDDWEKGKIEELRQDFKITAKDVVDEQIVYAAYAYENYSGRAFVIFTRDGQLFEVNGSHCSCYGLEQQWEPEYTSWEAIALRQEDIYGLSTLAMIALRETIAEHRGKE